MHCNLRVPSLAAEVDPAIASCLKAWGKQPFGSNPTYKTMSTSVKVFGIGANPADTERTSSPSLVLVNTGVNVMGGTTLELLNPNGWYCFKSNVNVMGSLRIKAACKAQRRHMTERRCSGRIPTTRRYGDGRPGRARRVLGNLLRAA
jgi:hypothetical protein